MVDYGSRANAICITLVSQTAGNGTGNAGIRQNAAALDTALSGLEQLVPPATVSARYSDLLANFKAAVELYKINLSKFIRLNNKLKANPNDKTAEKQLVHLQAPISRNLQAAAKDAHSLGMGRCETAFVNPNGG